MGGFPPGYWSEERYAVANAYPGKKWQDKVAAMTEAQVHQIWVSLQRRNERREQKSNEKSC